MHPVIGALSVSSLVGLGMYVGYFGSRIDTCVSLTKQYRFYGTLTTLSEATNGTEGPEWSEPCATCTPYKFIILSKHGSRYYDNAYQLELRNRLIELRSIIEEARANGRGTLCEEDFFYLENWTPLIEPDNENELSYEGWVATRRLGDRYRERYPNLLGRPYDPEEGYDFIYSDMGSSGNTTRETARAFITGLFGTFAGVELNTPESPDTLLEYHKHCERYDEEVPVYHEEVIDFVDGPWVEHMLRTMEIRLGFDMGFLQYTDLEYMFDGCGSEYSIRAGNAPWCVAFRTYEALIMEYSRDLYDYYRYGYGFEINQEMTCNLFKDLYEKLTEPTDTRYAVTGRWMERQAFSTLVSRLGLFEDEVPITAANYGSSEDREWRSSFHISDSSNLVFVVSNRTLGGPVVQVFHNERPVHLPICRFEQCTLDEIETGWASFAECDFDEICDIPGKDKKN